MPKPIGLLAEVFGLNFRVNHGGKFFIRDSVLLYEKRDALLMRKIDPEKVTKEYLEKKIMKKTDMISNIKELFYLEPKFNIDKGLRKIEDDSDIGEMMKFASWKDFVHLYVVQEEESASFELRAAEVGSENEREVGSETELRAAEVPSQLDEEVFLETEREMSFANSEDEEVGLETSSSEGEPNFWTENDDDFDDLGGLEDPPEELDVDDELSDEISSEEEFDELEKNKNKKRKKYPEFKTETGFKGGVELKVGMIFRSNEDFRQALKHYSVENRGDFYYLHNDNTKVSVYCKNKCDCPIERGRKRCSCKEFLCHWKACARKMATDGSFQLKSFNPKHECGWQEKNSKANSQWLAQKYIENYRDDPQWSLTAFMTAVLELHGVEITYKQAWRGRRLALLISQGDATTEYGRVWDYAATILKTNRGSSAIVKVDLGDPQGPVFERLYVCMVACKMGFLKGCRSFIGIDGCHLRGGYTGQILVALGKDGNNNIFPIAYALVEAERLDTWMWFINLLLDDVGESCPTFISDRQKGLLHALRELVPLNSDSRVCVRHMYNNFKKTYTGKAYKDLVWKAARAYTAVEFESTMNEIKSMDEGAYSWLMDVNTLSWARHHFRPEVKCDILLNNLCESFNAWILPAREMPVLSMMEWIRKQLMSRFYKKRKDMTGYSHKFTPKARELIEEAKSDGIKSCRVWPCGVSGYEVVQYGVTHVVDLKKKTCDCRKWELSGIPCSHALVCILKARQKVDEYVSKYYTFEVYMKAYNEIWGSMPTKENYVKTQYEPPLPPKYTVQPGRPKKNARRREEGEDVPSQNKRVRVVVSQKCSRCRQEGHNKRKCNSQTAKEVQLPKPKLSGGRPVNPDTVHFIPSKKRNNEKARAVKLPRDESIYASTSHTQVSLNEGASASHQQVYETSSASTIANKAMQIGSNKHSTQ